MIPDLVARVLQVMDALPPQPLTPQPPISNKSAQDAKRPRTAAYPPGLSVHPMSYAYTAHDFTTKQNRLQRSNQATAATAGAAGAAGAAGVAGTGSKTGSGSAPALSAAERMARRPMTEWTQDDVLADSIQIERELGLIDSLSQSHHSELLIYTQKMPIKKPTLMFEQTK